MSERNMYTNFHFLFFVLHYFFCRIYGDILGDIMNEMGKTTDGDQSKDYRGMDYIFCMDFQRFLFPIYLTFAVIFPSSLNFCTGFYFSLTWYSFWFHTSNFRKFKGLEHSGDLSAFSGADLSKRYTLFSLGHDGMQDVDVIIRGNNDGIDTTGSELAVVHKVEYAAEFGAEV